MKTKNQMSHYRHGQWILLKESLNNDGQQFKQIVNKLALNI
jgi:hypothetical protein